MPQAIAERLDHLLPRVAGGALARQRPFDLRFWDDSELPATEGRPVPAVIVRDPAAIGYLVRNPNQLGFARAWVGGVLDVEGSLEEALALRGRFARQPLSLADRVRIARWAWTVAGARALRRRAVPSSEARLRGRLHSERRDEVAVRHHYDVSPAFYRLLLGPSLVYSCAYFESAADSLEDAQARKLELICRKLRLRPGDRLLDIGCGWGSLVIHAASHHGVHAVGVTLSPAQAQLANDRIRSLGLANHCEVRLADYRQVTDGPYDAIASVGMYEHVGRGELMRYARTIAGLLAPGGLFLNHGIARLTPGPGHDRTFIARFVFPDGELHPVTDLLHVAHDSHLEIRDLESLREHYPLTLRRWLANLEEHREAAVREAGAERERIWRLYMSASARAFERGEIAVYQALFCRPGAPHRLPLSRAAVEPGDLVTASEIEISA
jgi:cyclopropane-fatty-acyl-phospholipid synthase